MDAGDDPESPPGLGPASDINISVEEDENAAGEGEESVFERIAPPAEVKNLPRLSAMCIPPYLREEAPRQGCHSVHSAQVEYVAGKLRPLLDRLTRHSAPKRALEAVRRHIQKRVAALFPKAQVHFFGSTVNGLSLPSGDIDCTIVHGAPGLHELEQRALDVVLASPGLAERINLPLAEYQSVLAQTRAASEEVERTARGGQRAAMSQSLVQKRSKWRNVILLAAVSTAFDEGEVDEHVFKARVPVLKLRLQFDEASGEIVAPSGARQRQGGGQSRLLQVDVCFNNLLPLHNTALLREYLHTSPLVRSLVLLVKEWANRRQLTLKYDTQLPNSYGLVLMVIFYMQMTGSVANLQDTNAINIVNGYNCAFIKSQGKLENPNIKLLAKYFMGFFHFYGYVFNFEKAVISIRLGRAMNRLEKNWHCHRGDINPYFTQWCDRTLDYTEECKTSDYSREALQELRQAIAIPISQCIPNISKSSCFLCIEDPFEINLNVAKNVDQDGLRLLKNEFKRGFSIIRRQSQDPVQWLLFSPLVDEPNQSNQRHEFSQLLLKQQKLDRGEMARAVISKAAPKKQFKLSLTAADSMDQQE